MGVEVGGVGRERKKNDCCICKFCADASNVWMYKAVMILYRKDFFFSRKNKKKKRLKLKEKVKQEKETTK